MRYNPALDGIRALAALAVVAFHSRVPGFAGGWVGVDVFFVLSGYLITRVLMENGDLARFYWRRARRLIPPLALMLAAYLAVFPFIVPDYPHGKHALIAFVYLSDYWHVYGEPMLYVGHTWSLAVEEQFYLLWPLILLRFKPRLWWLVVAYFAATAWRLGWFWQESFFRFDTRLGALILGCILARVNLPRFPAWPGLVALAYFCVTLAPSLSAERAIFIEAAGAVAIMGTQPAWLSARPLAYLGKLSYGIYLWHYPLCVYLRDQGLPWQQVAAITAGLSIALAALSYHTIEAWFRNPGTHKAWVTIR